MNGVGDREYPQEEEEFANPHWKGKGRDPQKDMEGPLERRPDSAPA